MEVTTSAKPKRKTIPASLKHDVWAKRNDGNEGSCYVCGGFLTRKNMDCGHIISSDNNGSSSLDNLEPICKSCNSSMGTSNMGDFRKMYFPKKIKTLTGLPFDEAMKKHTNMYQDGNFGVIRTGPSMRKLEQKEIDYVSQNRVLVEHFRNMWDLGFRIVYYKIVKLRTDPHNPANNTLSEFIVPHMNY